MVARRPRPRRARRRVRRRRQRRHRAGPAVDRRRRRPVVLPDDPAHAGRDRRDERRPRAAPRGRWTLSAATGRGVTGAPGPGARARALRAWPARGTTTPTTSPTDPPSCTPTSQRSRRSSAEPHLTRRGPRHGRRDRLARTRTFRLHPRGGRHLPQRHRAPPARAGGALRRPHRETLGRLPAVPAVCRPVRRRRPAPDARRPVRDVTRTRRAASSVAHLPAHCRAERLDLAWYEPGRCRLRSWRLGTWADRPASASVGQRRPERRARPRGRPSGGAGRTGPAARSTRHTARCRDRRGRRAASRPTSTTTSIVVRTRRIDRPVRRAKPGHQAVARARAELAADVEAAGDAVEDDAGAEQQRPGPHRLGCADQRQARVGGEADDDDVGDRAEPRPLPQRHPEQQHEARRR